MNFHQVSKVNLKPDVIDGIVFWTKNPLPMLDKIDKLINYVYYFQFTITPYGTDIESNLPPKTSDILQSFKCLADIIGPERVIWRYDPIFISEKYTYDYHINAFGKIADELRDYTKKVTFSFINKDYRGVKGNIKKLALKDFDSASQIKMSSQLAEIAITNGLNIDTCAVELDLKQFGIEPACCIDDRLFKKLLDSGLDIGKDKNQRKECGCVTSIDIGMYNTCKNGCLYCYANYNKHNVDINYEKHNLHSPFISGDTYENDKICMREIKSCRNEQIELFY